MIVALIRDMHHLDLRISTTNNHFSLCTGNTPTILTSTQYLLDAITAPSALAQVPGVPEM